MGGDLRLFYLLTKCVIKVLVHPSFIVIYSTLSLFYYYYFFINFFYFVVVGRTNYIQCFLKYTSEEIEGIVMAGRQAALEEYKRVRSLITMKIHDVERNRESEENDRNKI